MAHKMKGMEFGSPITMKTKHGKGANYKKSGMSDRDGKPVRPGAPGFFGKLLDPLGLKKKIGGLFGKGGGKPCPPPAAAPAAAAPVDPRDAAAPAAGMAPPPAAAATPQTPVVDPNAGVSAQGEPPIQ
jgi:hypothetical protein